MLFRSENVKFKKFLHFICPGFTPTTRQTIAGPCLDMAFAETSAKVNLFSVIVTIIIIVIIVIIIIILIYLTFSRLMPN